MPINYYRRPTAWQADNLRPQASPYGVINIGGWISPNAPARSITPNVSYGPQVSVPNAIRSIAAAQSQAAKAVAARQNDVLAARFTWFQNLIRFPFTRGRY